VIAERSAARIIGAFDPHRPYRAPARLFTRDLDERNAVNFALKRDSVRSASVALLLAALTASLALVGCSQESDAAGGAKPAAAGQKVRFSGIPNVNTTEMLEKNKPLADYLTKKLGVEFEYVPVADYNATVTAFKNGDIDMGWFGGYTGCQARNDVKGAQAIVCGAVDKKFKSYFVANKSLGLEKGDEFPMSFQGKKFTFGSPSSTSGRLMPEFFIRKHTNKSPKEFFGIEDAFSGGHDKTIAFVEAGTFECGAVDFAVYDKLAKENKFDPSVVQIIWVTPEYFDYQFTVRPDMDAKFGAGFTKKLTDVLTGISGDDLKVLDGIQRANDKLVTCSNEDFETLRKTAVEIGLLR
jgi:phosphonate transport system substrate-binding protein